MAKRLDITVKESSEELSILYKKTSYYLKPRIKMLQLIIKDILTTKDLCAKTGKSDHTIITWKKLYNEGGIAFLLEEKRGGDYRSGLDDSAKEEIVLRLSDPKNAFTSYGAAQIWINESFETDKRYHAVYQFLKRNYGVKLKVARKSHVNKDEAAVAFFKKPIK